MLRFEVASLKRAIQTLPEGSLCGDATLVIDEGDSLLLALCDGVGHGPMAYNVSMQVCRYLEQHATEDLSVLLTSLHEALMGTVGGVVAFCRIEKTTGIMQYSGVGNVTIRLFLPESKHLVLRDGVLGHQITNLQVNTCILEPGRVVMLYSDGIKENFDEQAFPHFFKLSAYDIARITIDYYSKALDDASCIVLKVNDD